MNLDLTDDYSFFGRDLKNYLAIPIKIVLILILATVINRLTFAVVRRVVLRSLDPERQVIRRHLRRATPNVLLRTEGNQLRAQARAQTLVSVSRSVIFVVVWLTAGITVLAQLGLNAATLLTSAGIIGVALGFGAQNIVRDFLAGFFIVVEDQFGVGDVVDLSTEAKGTVERISLRATSVRDVNGVVWHIPNGQILRAGNKSQLWARAVLDLEVAYDADLDRSLAVIERVAQELAADPDFSANILETPEVWGVESFTAEGMAIRVVLKTEPASQFGVLRALRGRIVTAFAAEGIEFGAFRAQPQRED